MKYRFAVALALCLGVAGHGAASAPPAANRQDARQRIIDALQNDPDVPKAEPAGHDATIIVFSDYQCPYCRQLHPTLAGLMHQDRKIRIVYRDWPIFGPASTEAARAAMASRYQGRHAAFNDALMNTKGRLTSQSIRAAATSAGIDWPRLQGDLTRHRAQINAALSRTDRYARLIGLSGTPALIVDSYLFPGAVDADTLKSAIQVARHQPPATASVRYNGAAMSEGGPTRPVTFMKADQD